GAAHNTLGVVGWTCGRWGELKTQSDERSLGSLRPTPELANLAAHLGPRRGRVPTRFLPADASWLGMPHPHWLSRLAFVSEGGGEAGRQDLCPIRGAAPGVIPGPGPEPAVCSARLRAVEGPPEG